MLFVVQAVVLFVWVPGEPLDRMKALAIVGGVVATLVVGEILLRRAQRTTDTALLQPGGQAGRA
jgi:hypothetical protein